MLLDEANLCTIIESIVNPYDDQSDGHLTILFSEY